ncbi:MAG TPA: hypothetical protein VFG14_17795 [Chthoniobacteraceae bacterium]|nr:hypothetical protein [Chthoniobacteraceae bacterium]
MKKLISVASIALSFLVTIAVHAVDSYTPDPEGYIRHWVMLAPIPLTGEEAGSEAIYKQQIRDEGALRPKAGDIVKIGGKELTWQNITATTNFFDFNAVLESVNDRAAGYMVTYIECETEKPDVIMAVASNDEGRIYFNGVDIYLFSEPRPLMLDADKGRVTLKKGVNVIVFKVTNEQNAWQGAMRLLDKGGAPLKDISIKQSSKMPTSPAERKGLEPLR